MMEIKMKRRNFIKGLALLGLSLKTSGINATTFLKEQVRKRFTLSDYEKQFGSNENRLKIIDILSQPSDLVKDMEWKVGNLNDSHEHTVITKPYETIHPTCSR